MMMSIHIHNKKIDDFDEVDEVKSLLPSQMLVSRHIELKESIKQSGDLEQLPVQLKELIQEIHQTWIRVSPSVDSRGILGLAIVHDDCDELLEVIEPSLRELGFGLEVCQLKDVNSQLKDAILHRKKTKADFAVCLMLDPIMNIGGALHQAW